MTTRTLYLSNLPWSTTEQELRSLFSQAGSIRRVKILYDAYLQRSMGSGFVEFTSVEEAQRAQARFHGSDLGGRRIEVYPAREREDRPSGAKPFRIRGIGDGWT